MIKFLKQPMMRRVLYALAPIYLYAIWMYGYRPLLAALVSFAFGVGTEWVFEWKRSGKVSEAALVTCALFSLAFPPATPLWILAVGIVFTMAMSKGVYGGFGRNIFNPAIAGRAFVYISFAIALAAGYRSYGNFGIGAADVVSSATPLGAMRAGGSVPLLDLILGQRSGAMGEGMILLILGSGIYLAATKTASWRIMVGSLAAAVALTFGLKALGVPKALPAESLLAGSYLFMTVFMATDPVSAPKRPASHFLYGALIGAAVVVIRTFSAFPEGTTFAVLFGNTFANLIDIAVDSIGKKAAAPAGGAK